MQDQLLINLKKFFVEYPVHVISEAVFVATF